MSPGALPGALASAGESERSELLQTRRRNCQRPWQVLPLTVRPFQVICRSMSAPAGAIVAWEPFTPRGVAAFASAGLGRLLLVQFIVALLAAAAVVWFMDKGCFPVMGAAVQKLPATGEIRSGQSGLAGSARRNCWPRAASWRWTWTWTTPARSARPPTCRSNLAGKPSGLFRCSVTVEWHYPARLPHRLQPQHSGAAVGRLGNGISAHHGRGGSDLVSC